MSEREIGPGFYWVRHKLGGWLVAEVECGALWFCGVEDCSDGDGWEIGPKIQEPPE